MNKKEKGIQGEEITAKQMKKYGYEILEKNYRAQNSEIDIIAKKENIIVFVEVKLRRGLGCGMPSEAVDRKKQQKIIDAAKQYIAENELEEQEFRFDVAEILKYSGSPALFHYIKNAFWEE